MLASCAWIFPANCCGFLFIVMRSALLEEVLCANHIVQALLMRSKPSDHSEFQALVVVSLMHMGIEPPAKSRLWVYHGGMVLRRTPHAVYETLDHLVWSPKYRRDVLQGAIQHRVQELCADIAEQYDITIEEMEVRPDHSHIFCSFPPRDSIAQVVTRFKRLRARAILREFPRIKRRLWGGELWEDGYFARTVGDKVTAEGIRRYIQPHRLETSGDAQMSLFA
jgi:putative transposase